MEQVAARFDVCPTQVSSWKNMAQRYGNEALASQKEKAAKAMEHKQKETQQLTKGDCNKHEMAAEITRLRAELDKTKKELYYARMDRDIAKKSPSSGQGLSVKVKTKIVTEIRAYQKTLPKERRYKIGDLLARIDLKRSSYYDECERMKNPYDKYVNVKKMIMEIAQSYIVRDRYTAGYRRIQKKLDQRNAHLADETIRKLIAQLKVQVAIYNQNRNGKYSSYRGTVGKTAKNLLEQKFNETQPYKVIHIDSTQTQLANQQKVYISVIVDEGTKEVLACQISDHPNHKLITDTLNELLQNLSDNTRPIIHSDQGWHYQLPYYTQKLADHHFTQTGDSEIGTNQYQGCVNC